MNTNYFVLCAAALVMFAACQKEENAAPKVSLTASLEQQIDNTTKTALGTENTVVWSEGDVIKVHGASGEEELTLSGIAGTTTGVFGATTVTNPDYAIYPASAYSSISSSTVTFTLPATQTYAENSFGPGANVAVAAISGNTMSFKNVCGVLKLQLKGSMKVKTIEITGKNGEKLNGTFTVDAAASPFVGAVKSGDPTDAEKKVTLDCSHFGETSEGAADGGVQLNAETATIFDIIVPVSAFAGGFEAKITDVSGETFYTTLATTKDNTIARSTVTKMPCKAVSLLPEALRELKYIQNSGSQWIDTGVDAPALDHTIGKFSFLSGGGDLQYICGTRSADRIALGFDVRRSNNSCVYVGTSVEYQCRSDIVNGIMYVSETTRKDGKWSRSINGGEVLTYNHSRIVDDGENYTLFAITAKSDPSSMTYFAKIKLYWYRMLNNNTYARAFIPAKVKAVDGVTDVKGQPAPQGTIGLYDFVEGKFYTNDGDGSFVAGPELTD